MSKSLSSWRAWIEITRNTSVMTSTGRSPHGERGLKSLALTIAQRISRRSPHGERGLK